MHGRCGWLVGVAVGAMMVSGCGSDRAVQFPLETLKAARSSEGQREAAIAQLRESAKANEIAAQRVRTDLEAVVRSTEVAREARVVALTELLSQIDEKADLANARLAAAVLGREEDARLVAMLSEAAGQRGWMITIPGLVRSVARPSEVAMRERPQAKALAMLAQGRPLEELLFEQFVTPSAGEAQGAAATDLMRRVRVDAWDALSNLDATGEQRRAMLARDIDAKSPGAQAVTTLRRADRELRVLAASGSEVAWLLSLRPDGADKAWWQAASAAVTRVPTSEVIALRHVEALRLTAAMQPERMAKSREDLLRELRARIEPRRKVMRTWKSPVPPYNEQLRATQAGLSWADLITVLAIDDAVSQGHVREALLPQALADRKDRTTEYGGVLVARTEKGVERVWPVLYPARAAQRLGDMRYMPSDDMLATAGNALAFYHLHAQDRNNVELAGPAESDMAYVEQSRRASVLFTSVGEDSFNVDYYGPGGVVIDLGTLSW